MTSFLIKALLFWVACIAVIALLQANAHATEFYPTEAAAKAAAHGKRIAWICDGKDTLYYVGKAGEQHCADYKRTSKREIGAQLRQGARTAPNKAGGPTRPSSASTRPPEPTALSLLQGGAPFNTSSSWAEMIRDTGLFEEAKNLLAQAMKEVAAARAAKVAEWQR